MFLLQSFTSCFIISFEKQRVWEIIHPSRRNLTTIRGYVRLGGLPDNPRTDPQDRSWFGPHDRLFTEEESDPLEFSPGPDYGTFTPPSHSFSHSFLIHNFGLEWNQMSSVVLGMGRCRRSRRTRRWPHLGTHEQQIDKTRFSQSSTSQRSSSLDLSPFRPPALVFFFFLCLSKKYSIAQQRVGRVDRGNSSHRKILAWKVPGYLLAS